MKKCIHVNILNVYTHLNLVGSLCQEKSSQGQIDLILFAVPSEDDCSPFDAGAVSTRVTFINFN